MKKQLQRIRKAANDARDCDVLIQRLKKRPSSRARKRWLEAVSAERAEAQKAIVAVHDRLERDDRFARRIGVLLERVRARGGERAGESRARFGDWARERLPLAVDAFFAAVPTDPTDEAALHRFRIRGKELRYVMELLAGAFPDHFRTTLYPTIEALQDRLGEINDLATAKNRLQAKIAAADGAAKVAPWRQLLTSENRRIAEARRAFWTWCTPAMLRDLRAGFDAVLADSQAVPLGAEARDAIEPDTGPPAP